MSADVPWCCAADALRANIANGEGQYAGGYHGDQHTAIKANVSLEVAQKRHPEHALTQPEWPRGAGGTSDDDLMPVTRGMLRRWTEMIEGEHDAMYSPDVQAVVDAMQAVLNANRTAGEALSVGDVTVTRPDRATLDVLARWHNELVDHPDARERVMADIAHILRGVRAGGDADV